MRFTAKLADNHSIRFSAEHRYGYLLKGIVIPLLLTLADWPFREILTSSNILMFYLLGVFFVAIRFGFWPSILASLTNAAAFAYYFAPPIFSFAITDPGKPGRTGGHDGSGYGDQQAGGKRPRASSRGRA